MTIREFEPASVLSTQTMFISETIYSSSELEPFVTLSIAGLVIYVYELFLTHKEMKKHIRLSKTMAAGSFWFSSSGIHNIARSM